MKNYEMTFGSKKIYPLTLMDVELDPWLTNFLIMSNREAATQSGKGNKAQD